MNYEMPKNMPADQLAILTECRIRAFFWLREANKNFLSSHQVRDLIVSYQDASGQRIELAGDQHQLTVRRQPASE